MEIDLTTIVVQVSLALITGIFGIIGLALQNFLKGKLSNEQLEFVNAAASIGVRAAEQLYGQFNGKEKLDYATSIVQSELDRRKIKVDVQTVRAAVEAAVVQEFNYGKLISPPTEVVMENREPAN